MACAPVTRLEELTLGHLRPLVGRLFRTRAPGGRPVTLRLLEVQDCRPRRRLPPRGFATTGADGSLVAVSPGGPADETPRPLGPLLDPAATRPFTLLFLGPAEPELPAEDYDLELPWLPLPGLRLSPLGRHGEGRLYESMVD